MILSIPAAYGEIEPVTASKTVDDFAQVDIVTKMTEADNMIFVVKLTSINLLSLDIKVQTVEANVVVTKGSSSYKTYKAIVAKEAEYIYNLVDEIEYLPLQMGSGVYKVSVLGSDDGRRYRSLSSQSFDLELEENAVYLSQSQTVSWDKESESTVIAHAVTKDLETDLEKMEAIHDYVIKNVRYDYVKAQSLAKGYIPKPDKTIEEGTGICYDFAALFGSMLRSVDIPAKLVKGYSSYTPVYHAWNEVLIGDEWIIVDTSTDSIFYDYKAQITISKPENAYVASKYY